MSAEKIYLTLLNESQDCLAELRTLHDKLAGLTEWLKDANDSITLVTDDMQRVVRRQVVDIVEYAELRSEIQKTKEATHAYQNQVLILKEKIQEYEERVKYLEDEMREIKPLLGGAKIIPFRRQQ